MCARFRGPVVTVLAITLLTLVLVAPSATAAIGDVVEWPTPTLGASPLGIAPGPDGALWFVERGADRIGRVTTAGTVTEVALPPTGGGPTAIAEGSDGAMWFTEQTTDSIGRIAMDQTVTEYPVVTAGSMPTGIALGPDGAMWFTERSANSIGRIAPDGSVTEYQVPTPASMPTGIALGPDGAMWFTEWRVSKIGRIALDGSIREFALPGGRLPTGIVTGPDGALWFTAPGWNAIGRITTSGTESELTIPTASSNPTGIALGPDGALWFTEQGGSRIGRIAGDGTIAEYAIPSGWSGPYDVTAGPDGNLWFTESSVSAIARLELIAARADLDPPVVTIAEPSDGAAYLLGQVVTAGYACTDAGGSGLATCEGPVASGSALDTSTAGVHVFEVTATDGAGNATTLARPYIVFTTWDGRIALPPSVATLRAGQPADLHFGLGGDVGPVLEPGSPFTQPVSCGSWTALAAIGSAADLGPRVHMTGGEYTFRWRTEKAWAGTCRSLLLPFTLEGGVTLQLFVRFV
jgi:virginiamycin B lyase